MTRTAIISAVLLSAALAAAQTAPPSSAKITITTSTTTQTKSTKTAHSKKKKSAGHVKPEPVKIEAPPQPPPPPPTLAQQAPVPPKVTYQNGLLSIDAPNSTLGDILSGIRRATGATVEGPLSSSDRMIVHLGPGEPRQVVASLLASSRFDYIVVSSPQQPTGVNRLVLMARQGSPAVPGQVVAGAPNAAVQPQRPAVVANTDEEDEETPERDEDNPPSQPVVAQPSPEQQPQPQQQPQQLQQYTGQPMPPDQNAPPQGQQDQQQANPNQPKTPEELYKELQNLERQRQQQQQQNQQQPQPPPQ